MGKSKVVIHGSKQKTEQPGSKVQPVIEEPLMRVPAGMQGQKIYQKIMTLISDKEKAAAETGVYERLFCEISNGEYSLCYDQKYAEQLFLEWRTSKKIDLVGKTANIVEQCHTEDVSGQKLKFVFKSGTISKVLKEFYNYCDLKRIEGISTFTTLGYLVSLREGNGFLLTLFEDHVIPVSTINFEEIRQEQRAEFITECAEVMGRLHACRITHNDAKLKNFSYSKRFSIPLFLVDLAKMNVTGADRKLSSQAVRYDLLTLLGSSVYHRMIRDEVDVKIFLERYVKVRGGGDSGDVKMLFEELETSLPLHPTDKNIQNLALILKK